MIYVDTSVALAHLLAEDVRPPAQMFEEPLVSSRLLEYEIWMCLNGRGLAGSHGDVARLLIGRFDLLALAPEVVARALDPFPTTVRTLDALHLATIAFLRERGVRVRLATYDGRMKQAATAMGVELYPVQDLS